MGSAMVSIVTIFEQERYDFYSMYINASNLREEVYETKYFIAPCTLNKCGLTWDFLVNSIDILLINNDNYKRKIRFVNFIGNREIKVLNFGRFSYLDDFIKYVINYKLNHNVNINKDSIEEIVDKFLGLKQEEIDRIHGNIKSLTLN